MNLDCCNNCVYKENREWECNSVHKAYCRHLDRYIPTPNKDTCSSHCHKD